MRSGFYSDDREQARCDRCRSPFMREPGARFKTMCPTCFKAERDRAAFERGYEAGRAEALRQAPSAVPADRLRALLQLAHPDRHGGSRLALETTQWLLDCKRQVRRGAEVTP